MAARAFSTVSPLMSGEEVLESNVFPFRTIPTLIRHVSFSQDATAKNLSLLRDRWPCRLLSSRSALGFGLPSAGLLADVQVAESARYEWKDREAVEGISSEHLITELLGKWIELQARRLGLRPEPTGRGVYFPFGLVPKNTLQFTGFTGRHTRVFACGFRKFGTGRFRYHLAPCFQVRKNSDGTFAAHLKVRIYITDEGGSPLEARSALVRRKKLCASWWNPQWLKRQTAIMTFLAQGKNEITGQSALEEPSLSALPITGTVNVGIDERLLEEMGASFGAPSDVDEENVVDQWPV
jgi:hypothetical protein